MLRKTFFLLVVLLAMAGLLAIPAMATEEPEVITWIYVNPEYADLDIPIPDPAGSIMAIDDIEYATTVEEAAAQLRAGMKARQNQVPVYIADDVISQAFVDEIFPLAVAHTGKPDEGDYIRKQFIRTSGSTSWDGTGYVLTYNVAYHTTAQQEAAVDTAVDALLEELDLYNATDYQKVCGVYDWMCENITYDNDGLSDASDTLEYTAYDAIVNKSAVCQGYANLFYRLMLELDVDTRIIAGDAFNGESTGGHAWNIVELSNKYYLVDSTWDASCAQDGIPYEYFLKGSTNFGTDHFPDPEYTSTAFQAEYPIPTSDYSNILASGECGRNLTWALNTDGVLTISGSGTMYFYSGDPAPWLAYVDQLTSVVIESGVASIGLCAFKDCVNIASVVIPDTVTNIWGSAFNGCTSLTEITIPGSVATINGYSFAYCSSLTDVVIMPGTTKIDQSAFYSCSSLQNVTIPDTVTEIRSNAFSDCSNLKSIHIPESVTLIDSYAFRGCSNLTEINIPTGITTITQGVFYDCSSLENITLPSVVTNIGSHAFSGCSSLKNVNIPRGVTVISNGTFYNCVSLKNIVLPTGLTEIGESAFSYCGFDHIIIPESVTSIGNYSFYFCNNLEEINLPSGITSIGLYVFYGCSSLNSITIHENVTSIASDTFGSCSNLNTVVFCGTEEQWQNITIGVNNTYLMRATLQYHDMVFTGCTTPKVCNFCGLQEDKAPGHSIEHHDAQAPTCDEIGWDAYETCRQCAYTTYVKLPAAGHTMGLWHISKQPACNAYGEIQRDCENCDAYESIQLAMGDHAYEAVVTKPTIGQQGYTTYTCAACGNSYVDNYTDAISAVAKIGDTEYASVSDALAVAKSGDTVIMIADAYEKTANLTVDEGITLNLGAYDLHAKSLNVLTGGMVTATGYAGAANDHGKLYVPSASRLIMSGISVNGNTAQLIPVWDEVDHYVFGIAQLAKTKYNQDAQGENQITAEKVYFDFAPAFKGEVRKDFFANDDGELLDNGIKIVLRVTWMSGDNVAQQDFVYGKELATKVANNSKTFCTFTLIGYAAMHLKLEDLKIVPMIVTDSGMILYGETFTCG